MKRKTEFIVFAVVLLAVLISGFADKNVTGGPVTEFSQKDFQKYLSFDYYAGGIWDDNSVSHNVTVHNNGKYDLKNVVVCASNQYEQQTQRIDSFKKNESVSLTFRFRRNSTNTISSLFGHDIDTLTAYGEIVR